MDETAQTNNNNIASGLQNVMQSMTDKINNFMVQQPHEPIQPQESVQPQEPAQPQGPILQQEIQQPMEESVVPAPPLEIPPVESSTVDEFASSLIENQPTAPEISQTPIDTPVPTISLEDITGVGVDSTQSPTAPTELNTIMPDTSDLKPKAMERNPVENSLATPLPSVVAENNPAPQVEVPPVDNVSPTVPTAPVPEFTNQLPTDVNINANVSSQGKKLDDILGYAIENKASDVHFTVGYPAKVRIDSKLVDYDDDILDPVEVQDLIYQSLDDQKKENLEINREVDYAYQYNGAITCRFRVNAYYTRGNLAAAFRLIPYRISTMEELMLPQIYHEITKKNQGLVLVTGPTGSGKTTTLAAMLEDINRNRSCHMITIEDPIEYVYEGKKALIDQRELNDDTYSWTVALKSVLRQDPDVILVGEMRDYETMAAAITCAETGHLVFATLHTNSASQTIDRVIDVFPENQQPQIRSQLSSCLNAIIAQRLVPLNKGGRRAVSEIMFNTPAIGNLIRESNTNQIDNIIRTSADIGMTFIEKSLANLVREGEITVDVAEQYAVHPEELLRLLNIN